MSFYAWAPKAPRGFGRVRGYTAPLPGPQGAMAYAQGAVAEATRQSRSSLSGLGFAPLITFTPPPVTVPTLAVTTTVRSSAAPAAYTPPPPRSPAADAAAAAAERFASTSGGTSTTSSSGNSATDEIFPGGAGPMSADGDMPFPDVGVVGRTVPWWVYFGGGILGGAVLVGVFGR